MGIEYTLIRSQRKTVAIHITKDATVEVRAPLRVSKAEIERFIAAKERWITCHLTKRKSDLAGRVSFSLDYSDMVTLLGKEYPIQAKDGICAGFDGDCFYLPPNLTPERIKELIVQTYIRTAKSLLMEKAAKYAQIMNVTPTGLRITSAKTRWGSCSGRNSINFSWRLIMAEETVVDYVVVHELAHIKEHNHSARFWAVVAEVVPDYKDLRRKLKALQEKLSREDWD